MKILLVEWFHSVVGIVVGEDEVTKERKAYVGIGVGKNLEEDIEHIKKNGTRAMSCQFKNIADLLDGG